MFKHAASKIQLLHLGPDTERLICHNNIFIHLLIDVWTQLLAGLDVAHCVYMHNCAETHMT